MSTKLAQPRVAFLAGRLRSTSPGSSQVVACDLLDKLDDASPQHWRFYAHERLDEREPVGRGKELRHIGGRRQLSNFLELPGRCGAPSKKNATGFAGYARCAARGSRRCGSFRSHISAPVGT